MGERGDGVFIRPKSSKCPVLRAYVWYLSTVVHRLFRTTKYYLVDIVNSAMCVYHFGARSLYCSQSMMVLSV
jgi:hypothetical protein